METFKRPLSTTKEFHNLLDLDNSVFRNLVGTSSEADQPTKKLKTEDGHSSQEDLFDETMPVLDLQPNDHPATDDDDEQLEQFEFELDEHCDFTLMQFVQGSQAASNTNPSKSTQDKDNFVYTKDTTSEQHRKDEDFSKFEFSQSWTISQFQEQGSYYGLPDKVKRLIEEHKGIKQLYEWQDECLNLKAVNDRQNLIYALPTSSGKTLVAEILIFRELVCQRRDVLFILPFVSIVKEKISGLASFAVDLDFYLEEYAAGQGVCPPRERHKKNSVYIATIEKGLALVDSLIEVQRLKEIGLVVVDELHLLGEAGRGAILETVLTKVKCLSPDTQIIGMSATIGNLEELAIFLDATIYRQEFRPVELKEFVKCGRELMAVEKDTRGRSLFVAVRTDDFGYDEQASKIDSDHIGGLVMEVAPKHALLIFCPIKRNCQDVAINLTRVLKPEFLEHRKADKERLIKFLRGDSNQICDILNKTIPYGVAYHHSGLTTDERRLIEDAYRAGVLCVICCTSTLAAGVNLPAQRVIIRSPYVGKEFLTQSRYKQMIGRAGRAGFGVHGESFLILSRKDKERVNDLIDSPMTEAITSMHLNDCYGLRNLILSSISLKIATSVKQLKRLVRQTFFAVQADRLGLDVKCEVERTIKSFFKLNALAVKDKSLGMDAEVEIEASQFKPQFSSGQGASRQPITGIKSTSELEISPLGRAAVKACVDLAKARLLYDDLKRAQRGLVLLDYLHLLFIVTPPDVNVFPKLSMFYDKYNKLSPDQLHTARMIGIPESLAIRIVTGKPLSTNQTNLINRFFVTLILQDLWNLKSAFDVSRDYGVNRGLVQNLVSLSASYSASVSKFCQEIKEFWAFEAILNAISSRLRHCCSAELMPLMELPSVRLSRAKQLYANGFRNIEAIARADAQDLVNAVEFLSKRQARQIVSAAIVMLKDKMESLEDEVEILKTLIGRID